MTPRWGSEPQEIIFSGVPLICLGSLLHYGNYTGVGSERLIQTLPKWKIWCFECQFYFKSEIFEKKIHGIEKNHFLCFFVKNRGLLGKIGSNFFKSTRKLLFSRILGVFITGESIGDSFKGQKNFLDPPTPGFFLKKHAEKQGTPKFKGS